MNYKSIPDLFFSVCKEYDKKNAVMYKKDEKYISVSHDFFKQRVTNLGRGLMAIGMDADDHIALLSETRFEWAIVDMAILSAGGVVVPLYPSLNPEDVSYILEDSQAQGIVVSSIDQLNKVMQIRDKLPNLKFIICMEQFEEKIEGVYSLSDVESIGSETDNEGELKERWKPIVPSDLLTIIYTSGTTGKPKGVMLSHGNLISNVESALAITKWESEDVCLSHLPLSHVFERMAGYYMMLAAGITIAYAEDIPSLSINLAEIKPTILVSVPRLFEKIYARIINQVEQGSFIKKRIFYWAIGISKKSLPYLIENKPLPFLLQTQYKLADKLVFGKIRERTGGRLKIMVSGGAALPKSIAEVFLGIGLKILEGYGLTETSPVICVNRPEKVKPGFVGPPIKDVQVKIADDGEIIVKGPNIMLGYYNNEKGTREVLTEDGWFHTGDIGEFDEEGYLKITDRKKELLVTSGGKNVAPQPLENALKFSQYIEQCVVVGDGQKFISALVIPPWETIEDWAPLHNWETNPVALSKNRSFYKAIEKDIHKLQKDFARYEQIKKFAILPNYLTEENGEMTPSLKVKRKVVNKKYADIIAGFYEE